MEIFKLQEWLTQTCEVDARYVSNFVDNDLTKPEYIALIQDINGLRDETGIDDDIVLGKIFNKGIKKLHKKADKRVTREIPEYESLASAARKELKIEIKKAVNANDGVGKVTYALIKFPPESEVMMSEPGYHRFASYQPIGYVFSLRSPGDREVVLKIDGQQTTGRAIISVDSLIIPAKTLFLEKQVNVGDVADAKYEEL